MSEKEPSGDIDSIFNPCHITQAQWAKAPHSRKKTGDGKPTARMQKTSRRSGFMMRKAYSKARWKRVTCRFGRQMFDKFTFVYFEESEQN